MAKVTWPMALIDHGEVGWHFRCSLVRTRGRDARAFLPFVTVNPAAISNAPPDGCHAADPPRHGHRARSETMPRYRHGPSRHRAYPNHTVLAYRCLLPCPHTASPVYASTAARSLLPAVRIASACALSSAFPCTIKRYLLAFNSVSYLMI